MSFPKLDRILRTSGVVIMLSSGGGSVASAQPAAPAEPDAPPIWEVQLGASFVGTSGNSDTSSFGANFEAHRRWPAWVLDGVANTVDNHQNGVQTAEQFMAGLRARRAISERISATSGIKLERDPFAGIDVRSTLDGGLAYSVVKRPQWTFDALSSIAWTHEDRVTGETLDEVGAVLGALNKYTFGTTGDTTQRFTFYPNFTTATRYRSEAEVTAQAAMNKRLALKLGFLWRYAHDPVPGFKRSDTTTTASIVVRWRAAVPALAP
jgi:putative salt-induced outer membrane protein YdiY